MSELTSDTSGGSIAERAPAPQRAAETPSERTGAPTQPFRRSATTVRRPNHCGSASTGNGSPVRPATRSPPRCWPTGCGSSAARSNTTGRAASCRPDRRSPTRWSNCATGAGASPIRGPRRRSSTTGSSPSARTAGLRSASTMARHQFAGRAGLRSRLLLQDLHVAGGLLGTGLRAADPPRRGPRPRRRDARSRPLRQGVGLLRRAGDRRRPRRPDGGADGRALRRPRHPGAGGLRPRRPPAGRGAQRRRPVGPRLRGGRNGRTRRHARGPHPYAHHAVRGL